MKHDIAAGMDNTTLNAVIKQVHTVLYTNVFKHDFPVNLLGIASVYVDIKDAPVVGLMSGKLKSNLVANAFASNKLPVDMPEDAKKELTKLLGAATFNLDATGIELGVKYSAGGSDNLKATLTCNAAIKSSVSKKGKNVLTIAILSASIKTNTSKPDLDKTLNEALVPLIILFLNSTLFSAIEIPALEYGRLLVSMPVPVVNQPYFTAYSCIGTGQADIPSPIKWPGNCIYISLNDKALLAAASIPFPLGPGTGFNWKIISGRVEAQVKAPRNIIVGADGSLTATITAQARAQLIMDMPWPIPDIKFGPNAQADMTVTFKPSVANGKLLLTVVSPPIPNFSFDWGISDALRYLLYPLMQGLSLALNAIFKPLLVDVFKIPAIPIMTLPEIEFTVLGKTLKIKISQAQASSLNGTMLINAKAGVTS